MKKNQAKRSKDDDSTVATVSSSASNCRLRFVLKRNVVFPITHINDMSEQDVRETWYEPHDYDRMKKNMIPIIRKIMRGETVEETKKQTTRGLEYRTREGAMKREDNKKDGFCAVLNEQARQRRKGIRDDELIGDAYHTVASHCQDAAHNLGLEDEAEIEEELKEMRQNFHRNARNLQSKVKLNGLTKLFKQVYSRTKRSSERCSNRVERSVVVAGT